MRKTLLGLVVCCFLMVSFGFSTTPPDQPPLGDVLTRFIANARLVIAKPELGFTSAQIQLLNSQLDLAEGSIAQGDAPKALRQLGEGQDSFVTMYYSMGGLLEGLRVGSSSPCDKEPYNCELDCGTLRYACKNGSDGACTLCSIYCKGQSCTVQVNS